MPSLANPADTPRAFTRATVTVLAAVVCAAIFVAISVTVRAQQAQREMQQDLVLRGADAISLSFNTALRREWDSLHAVAANIGQASPGDMNDFMDAVAETGGQVAWAGIADTGGTIISGSNRLREGESVTERRWFREGLRRPSVGNAYLSSTMPLNDQDERQSLLNLSTPVRDASGAVTGVLVYSLRMAWVEAFLDRAKEELRIDVVVQTRDGDTLVDTRPETTPLPESVVSAASFGQTAAGAFRLLGRTQGLYAFTPTFVHGSLPDFGWRVFAVLDEEQHTDILPALMRGSVLAVTLAAAFVLGATILILRILLTPIEKLTRTATGAARGEFDYPVESKTSREALLLSRALVTIQAELATRRWLQAGDGRPYLQVIKPGAPRGPLALPSGTDPKDPDTPPANAPAIKRAGQP